MKKDQRSSVVEFVNNLSDEDLKYLGGRLVERYPGDLGEALNCLSRTPEIDHILTSAPTSTDFFDLCDVIKEIVVKEAKKRGIIFTRSYTSE